MHHVRGLVRRAGRRTLHSLEARVAAAATPQACVRPVQLQDLEGRLRTVPLLHCGALLKMVGSLQAADALRALRDINTLLEEEDRTAPIGIDTSCVLYVKDACAEAAAEVRRRQRRFIAKVRGRFLSSDPEATQKALQAWLRTAPAPRPDVAVAEYRGMVEALVAADPPSAVAMAINPQLPNLTSGASAALAGLVNLEVPAAVHAFLESFASKDEATLAAESCATHLAVRLRKELSGSESAGKKGGLSSSPRGREVVADLLNEATRFAVDPSVVYPTEPAAIQRWSNQFLDAGMLPRERAAALTVQVHQRRLVPRRVSMDALSAWTLTDLERPWLRMALNELHSVETEGQEEADSMLYNAAYQLALKDPKRNLVDNRLLRTYAHALRRGDISPLDDSFAGFLEECGECHSASGAASDAERPSHVTFALPRPPEGVPLKRALHDLAPQCSYWRTLLERHGDTHVEVHCAPLGEAKVQVRLPAVHECVVAAKDQAVPLPALPVLYEDADVLVVDKPAGLATSRHALSCTQAGAPTTDLISVLLCTKFRDAANTNIEDVFRQGQVHRLDAETSGCLLIAKSNTAADSLRHQMGTSAAFSHHSKIYHALCVVLEPSLNHVKLHDDISDPADPKIRTRYRVLRFFPQHRVAWVECRLQQGKKHQIRRHLASRGFPIVADVEHGGAACCQSMIDRVALHARSVSFVHPVTGEPVVVTSPLPADFRHCLAQLNG